MLDNQTIHDAFKIYGEGAAGRGIAVGRYVIMPDHVHLFVRFPLEGMTLPRWIQGLRVVLGKALLEQRRDKPYWQAGFFDHVLRGNESYEEKWAYVVNNPVRAGLVATAEDWPYHGEVGVIDRV